MACEERDAAKRLLAEKQRAALSPEPSALSLNPEDSELEGGATVGPQATVYTQTAQFEPLEVVPRPVVPEAQRAVVAVAMEHQRHLHGSHVHPTAQLGVKAKLVLQ